MGKDQCVSAPFSVCTLLSVPEIFFLYFDQPERWKIKTPHLIKSALQDCTIWKGQRLLWHSTVKLNNKVVKVAATVSSSCGNC